MVVNVSIFYQNLGVPPSKVYYSNTRHYFCMNLDLLLLRAILHLRKNSKCDKKAAYVSVEYDGKYVNYI